MELSTTVKDPAFHTKEYYKVYPKLHNYFYTTILSSQKESSKFCTVNKKNFDKERMKNMIRSLHTLKRENSVQFGAKAANLGELISMGMPVPEGFALSIDFLHEFMKLNKIGFLPDKYLEFSSEIRKQILEGQFSPDLSSILASGFSPFQQE